MERRLGVKVSKPPLYSIWKPNGGRSVPGCCGVELNSSCGLQLPRAFVQLVVRVLVSRHGLRR